MKVVKQGCWGYRSYREHLSQRFPGKRIRKLCLNAGFTCPNLDGAISRGGCTYCNNRGFVPKEARRGDLLDQWERGKTALCRRHGRVDSFIAYFQAFSNTYAPLHQLRKVYDDLPGMFSDCIGVSIGTRPDCLAVPIVDYLEDLSRRTFLTVEIGLQSDRDEVLKLTNRGHSVQTFLDTVDRVSGRGFEICVHFILGLPGQGEDAPERMGALAASLPIESVKLHNLHIMKGTLMAGLMQNDSFQVPDQLDHLQAVAGFIRQLRSDQFIQRVIADAPDRLLLSDPWCHDKQGFLKKLQMLF